MYPKHHEKKNAFLGIDWGEKRIGLAYAADEQSMPLPWGIIENVPRVAGKIGDLIRRLEVGIVVIGMPAHLDGKKTEFEPNVRSLAKEIAEVVLVEVHFEDERLTSRAVQALFQGAPRKRGRHNDDVAAQLILENFLHRRRANNLL